jgi:hypothetical protein
MNVGKRGWELGIDSDVKAPGERIWRQLELEKSGRMLQGMV